MKIEEQSNSNLKLQDEKVKKKRKKREPRWNNKKKLRYLMFPTKYQNSLENKQINFKHFNTISYEFMSSFVGNTNKKFCLINHRNF